MPSLSYLFSRLRLATIKPAESRHPNSPLLRSSPNLAGPFLETSLPSWAANALERSDRPRGAAAFMANRRDTGANYLVHGLQCGDLQLRIVIPIGCPGAAELFGHLAKHEQTSVMCAIDDSTQAVELEILLDRQAAAIALEATPVEMTEAVLKDEAQLLFSLVQPKGMRTLIPDQQVQDVIVIYCVDPAPLGAKDSKLARKSHQRFSAKVH